MGKGILGAALAAILTSCQIEPALAAPNDRVCYTVDALEAMADEAGWSVLARLDGENAREFLSRISETYNGVRPGLVDVADQVIVIIHPYTTQARVALFLDGCFNGGLGMRIERAASILRETQREA